MTALLQTAKLAAGAAVVAGILTLVEPVAAAAQTIEQRVSAVPSGKVRFTFAARPGVCGHGSNITIGRSNNFTRSSDPVEDVEYDTECGTQPVRVVLTVAEGRVSRVKTYVGGRWRQPQAQTTDLGAVGAQAAADYLLLLAERGGEGAREAMFPATLADSVVVWPGLLRIARTEGVPAATRKSAIFWLSQAAGEAITSSLVGLVASDTINRELREHAVFALSQRPKDEGVPALIQIARSHRDPAIRNRAMFWLGQSRDPRALALFEEILTRR